MIKNLLVTIAAAGLAIAPIAAQAGTRASDAGVSMNGLTSLDRAASPVGEVEQASGIPTWLLIMLFAGAGLGIVLAVESSEDNKSPGT